MTDQSDQSDPVQTVKVLLDGMQAQKIQIAALEAQIAQMTYDADQKVKGNALDAAYRGLQYRDYDSLPWRELVDMGQEIILLTRAGLLNDRLYRFFMRANRINRNVNSKYEIKCPWAHEMIDVLHEWVRSYDFDFKGTK